MAYPRFMLSKAHRRIVRSTGSDMSLTSTAYAELAAATNGPGTGGFDIVLEAQVGDVIRAGFAAALDAAAVATRLDVGTIVSGSPVNYFMGGSSFANHGWTAPASVASVLGPAASYVMQAGDIASGRVTLRPYYIDSAGTARTLYSGSTGRFEWWAHNVSPADSE